MFKTKTITTATVDFPQPVKPNWGKFEKLMTTRIKAVKADRAFEAANPTLTWSIVDHYKEVWNAALDEVEENISIFLALAESEWNRGERLSARLHHEQAQKWYAWGKKIESASHAEYFAYHWEYVLGL